MKYDLRSLTLDEKIKLLTGKNTWELYDADGKLPSVFLSDGPHGLRMMDTSFLPELRSKKATAMPTLSALANSWDTELAYLDGSTIAEECIEKGAQVLLAPGVNIKRTPLCGRNFEYFSEDPLLAGTMAKAYIEGVQSKGVGTSLKHFCANNREYNRDSQSSEVDERTLREIYLAAFEIALEARPFTVMCSYNRINGIYASENRYLLEDILRGEFGFDGLIVSDWGAVHDARRAVKAGIDLTMPYRAESFDEIKQAYERGLLTEAEIDERAEKVLELIEKTQAPKPPVTLTKEERHKKSVEIARECIVLLKNEDGILPIRTGKTVVDGPFKWGAAIGGFGSSETQTAYVQKPLAEELKARLPESCEIITTDASVSPKRCVERPEKIYRAAYGADSVILCVGTGNALEGETFDRAEIRLPREQEDLILRTAQVNENVVVVLETGSAVDVSPWIDKVKAVLYAGFAGEGAQEAIADVLTGKVCPCGKLAETFPLCLEDTPTNDSFGNGFVERYEEGVLVGYRYYDTLGKEVAFPFGHGLSYASFEYSELEVTKESESDYTVSFSVKNVSDVDSKEIVQVYVRDVFSYVTRPNKELKAFEKLALRAGESKRVSVKLDKRAFAYYSTPLKDWFVENGDFEILVGASSRDIRLTARINVSLPDCEQYTL